LHCLYESWLVRNKTDKGLDHRGAVTSRSRDFSILCLASSTLYLLKWLAGNLPRSRRPELHVHHSQPSNASFKMSATYVHRPPTMVSCYGAMIFLLSLVLLYRSVLTSVLTVDTSVEFLKLPYLRGHAVAKLVEALRYKPECHGLEFFIDIIVSVALWSLGRLSL
jgi:hypothetical protein